MAVLESESLSSASCGRGNQHHNLRLAKMEGRNGKQGYNVWCVPHHHHMRGTAASGDVSDPLMPGFPHHPTCANYPSPIYAAHPAKYVWMLIPGGILCRCLQVYAITDSPLCLTGTAEVPLGAVYMDRIIPEEQLPIKMTAFGHCFRTEAGASGS